MPDKERYWRDPGHHRTLQRRYYKRHREKVKARERERYHGNRLREQARCAGTKARLRGVGTQLTPEQWAHVLAFYGGRCAYTGESANGVPLQLEHVLPLCLGGAHELGNVVPAKPEINLAKGSQHPAEFLAALGLDEAEFFARVDACTAAWNETESQEAGAC